MEKEFVVVLEPKRGWREGCAVQFVVVKAKSKAEAIRSAEAFGAVGDAKYFKKPTAELFGINYVYRA